MASVDNAPPPPDSEQGDTQPPDAELEALRQVGRHWPARARAEEPEDISPDLTVRESRMGHHHGGQYLRVGRRGRQEFRPLGGGVLQATQDVPRGRGPLTSALTRVRELLIGNPLSNEQAIHERLTKVKALAVLSSDALSSVAYATGAMTAVLILAGTQALNASLGIAAAIAALLAIVGFSYRQTIKAYPRGGGSYIVARDNLGDLAGLAAGASLMIDYVMTVAVSISAGVAALVSLDAKLVVYTVPLDLAFVVLLFLGNLRGIRESGTIFMLPTYLFVIGIYALLVVGAVRFLGGGGHVAPYPVVARSAESLTIFLVLRAFASGCTALTGVEAISDGVPAFKPPEWKNARATLTIMATLAIGMFVGITLLVHAFGLVPNPGDNPPTLLSKLAAYVFGSGPAFIYIQITTALILALAANTAYSDFPRLLHGARRLHAAPVCTARRPSELLQRHYSAHRAGHHINRGLWRLGGRADQPVCDRRLQFVYALTVGHGAALVDAARAGLAAQYRD